MKVNAGEIIFNIGDYGDCAYLIEEGKVDIYIQKDGNEFKVNSCGPGDIFGEMAIIDNLPRSATAKANIDTVLSVVTQDQLNQRIDSLDPVVRLLVSVLIKRIRANNGEINQNIHKNKLAESAMAAITRLKLESSVESALLNNEFQLYYQPIVDLTTYDLKGFEALIRWIKPDGTMIPPSQFIDSIEESNLIIPLGKWITEQAFIDSNKFKNELNYPDLFISINVSGKQFADPNFIEDLEHLRIKHQVTAKNIKLEVTERIFMQGMSAQETIEKCRQLGYKISLDDFGTGFSSLTYLVNLNVDTIKIDRSFITNIRHSDRLKGVVKAILNMAEALNIGVIVEGIETTTDALTLRQLGAKMAQGYLFSKPANLETNIDKYSQQKPAKAS